MKWRIKAKPKVGDLRVTTRFAFFPKTIGNVRVWLEDYHAIEEFTHLHVEAGHGFDGPSPEQNYWFWKEKTVYLDLPEAIGAFSRLKKAER